MKKYKWALCFVAMLPGFLFSQRSLSLQEAIAIGLDYNHDVILMLIDTTRANKNATIGNAGMLPSVILNASANKSNSNINQKFSTGLELTRNGVGSGAFNSGIALNWTLFDGFKMFVSYKKLLEMSTYSELELRNQMESTVFQIISGYYNIALQEQKRRSIENLMDIYRERVRIAQTRLDLGNGNLADVLQAKLALNEQLSLEAQQKTLVINAKSSLNLIIGAEEKFEFTFDSLVAGELLPIAEYEKQLLGGNTALKLAGSRAGQAFYAAEEIRSQRYPRLGLGLNYNLSRSNSEAGFALLNQNLGFTYGLNLSWTVFNGSQIKSATRNAWTDYSLARINMQFEQRAVENALQQAYVRLVESHELITIEKESVSLATQSLSLIMERFKLGQSTSLEVKDAQNSLVQAQFRLADAQYQAKVAEAEIHKMVGTLL